MHCQSSHSYFRALGLQAVVSGALLFALPAFAQEDAPSIGTIEGAEVQRFPIAIPDFRSVEGNNEASRFTRILRNDLENSSVFEVLNPKSYIDTDGLEPKKVKFEDWLNTGANGLVKARVAKSTVELWVYEVASKKLAFTQKYAFTQKNERQVAHQISDDVYKAFTGEPGIFQTQIAMVRKVAGEKQIFVMDYDGDNARAITKGGTLNLLPSWSPSGKSVLFTSYRYDNPDLFEVSIAGGTPRRLSKHPGLNTGGKVSPDNTRIALTLSKDGNSEIYLLDRQGNTLKRLTQKWGIDTSPAWSPNGRELAFVSSRAKNPHIYIMNSDGSGAKRLTYDSQGSYNQTPAFSPKGDKLVYTGRTAGGNFNLFVYDLKSGENQQITTEGSNEDPTFSPNGRLIAFTSTRNGGKQVWITSVDGVMQKQITLGAQNSNPAWGPFKK